MSTEEKGPAQHHPYVSDQRMHDVNAPGTGGSGWITVESLRAANAEETGVALVLVLSLIALLGVFVGAYALVATMHVTLGESLRHSDRARFVAGTGVEAWLSRVRADAVSPDTPPVDHFGESWGWGGTLLPGVPATERVYVPSLKTNPRTEEAGYFELVRLEDEGGKIDLRDPPADPGRDTASLAGGGVGGRSFTRKQARRVLRFVRKHPHQLMTLGGLLGVKGIGPGSLPSIRRVYSPYRSKLLNVNTAPYEALRGLQVNPAGHAPTFMTRAMAEAVMARRSCSSVARSPHRIRPEDYRPGCSSSNPFVGPKDLCTYLNREQPGNVIHKVSCDVLEQHVTASSSGFLSAVVRGVALDENGGTVAETCLGVVVHRGSRADLQTVHRRRQSCSSR